MRINIYGFGLLLLSASCNNGQSSDKDQGATPSTLPPAILRYSVINTYPHDSTYFTEGLEFHNGQLYESSGGNLDESPYPSALGIANLQTGKVDTKVVLDRSKYFGEGITFFNDTLYQLTWRSGTGFIYHGKTFERIREFKIPAREGWGLTHDSTYLYMSDGTSSIYVLHPGDLKVVRTITVSDNTGPVGNINELEWVDGFIYANQWETHYILRIDPNSGQVTGKLNLDSLVQEMENKYPDLHELNGIAWNSEKNSFIITGKKWPVMYEIRLQ